MRDGSIWKMRELRWRARWEKKVSDLRHRLELVCSRMDGLSPLKKDKRRIWVRDGCRWKTCGDSDRIASWGYADRPSGRMDAWEAEIREVYQENLLGKKCSLCCV